MPRKRSSTYRKKPTFRKQKASRRGKRRTPQDIIHYNPKNTNCILPREYYTNFTSKWSGVLAAGTFSAGGLFNSADMNLDATNVVTPFRDFPAAGITWLDGVSPLALPATSSQQLFGPAAYAKALVYKTKVTWFINPSVTSSNDSIQIALVPTLNNTSPASTITKAYKQPYMKFKEFKSVGKETTLSFTIDWPKFIGGNRKDFMDDINDVYANTVTVGSAYSAPTRPCFITTLIQTLDCAPPSQSVPFTYEIKHYVKMSEYIYALTP